VQLEIQNARSGIERSFVAELNQLRKRSTTDRLFHENFKEISERITCKIPHSQGSENLKRLVLTAYEHVCRKSGDLPEYALLTRAVLQDAVLSSKSREA